jgi:hypothetical protein
MRSIGLDLLTFKQRPLQPLSVTGDYQKSAEAETRLPVAGYMEAHFNKTTGEPGRADFRTNAYAMICESPCPIVSI